MRAPLRHKSKYRKPARIVLASVSVLLLGLWLPSVFSWVASVVMYPIHATNVWLEESSSLVPSFIRDRQSLVKEIEDLNTKLVVASRSSVTQQRLLEENSKLRNLLGSSGESRIMAAVIARPDELPYDLLQIDRGIKHGVEVGAPVFVGRDVVIGLVVHVADDYSFVELFTTPEFEASVFISGPNVVATMEGRGGGVARVRVPQGVPITVGNLVHVPSVEPGVFGRISYVENRPTQPEQYGYITPELSISSLFQVSVGELSQISRSADEIEEKIRERIKTELLLEDIALRSLSSTTASSTDEEVSESE